MSDVLRMVLSAVLLFSGILIIWISVFGVFRFRFVMNRMHSAAMIDTLGLFLILTGLMFVSGELPVILKLLLILLFQWIGSPIASHMVGRLEVSVDPDLQSHVAFEHHEEDE